MAEPHDDTINEYISRFSACVSNSKADTVFDKISTCEGVFLTRHGENRKFIGVNAYVKCDVKNDKLLCKNNKASVLELRRKQRCMDLFTRKLDWGHEGDFTRSSIEQFCTNINYVTPYDFL